MQSMISNGVSHGALESGLKSNFKTADNPIFSYARTILFPLSRNKKPGDSRLPTPLVAAYLIQPCAPRPLLDSAVFASVSISSNGIMALEVLPRHGGRKDLFGARPDSSGVKWRGKHRASVQCLCHHKGSLTWSKKSRLPKPWANDESIK